MKKIIYNKYLTRLVYIICLFLIGHTANAQNKVSNFSGTWLLNEDKCDFGRLTAASASKIRTLVIDQSAITITITSGDSTTKSSIVLNLDGKPSEQTVVTVINEIPNTSKKEAILKILTNTSFVSTMNDPVNMPSSSVKTYTISADGQMLTIEYKNMYGEQLLAGKLVYDKKKG